MRLAAVATAAWPILILLLLEPRRDIYMCEGGAWYFNKGDIGGFLLVGVVPPLAIWAVIWVVAGFRNKKR